MENLYYKHRFLFHAPEFKQMHHNIFLDQCLSRYTLRLNSTQFDSRGVNSLSLISEV